MVAHLEHFVARVTDVLQEQGESAVADRPETTAAAGSSAS
jgi:hypothetical protein